MRFILWSLAFIINVYIFYIALNTYTYMAWTFPPSLKGGCGLDEEEFDRVDFVVCVFCFRYLLLFTHSAFNGHT